MSKGAKRCGAAKRFTKLTPAGQDIMSNLSDTQRRKATARGGDVSPLRTAPAISSPVVHAVAGGPRDWPDPQRPLLLEAGAAIILDWHTKRTGWLTLGGSGRVAFDLASDSRMFDVNDQLAEREEDFCGDRWPTYCAGRSRGVLELREPPARFQQQSNAFRMVRLRNPGPGPVRLTTARLDPSEFPGDCAGSFRCSDDLLNAGWQMGIDTVRLCTQPGDQSNVPVFGPFGDGYVQWDGCRRDREIWGGDLRPGALAWYYNFADQTPIANSLYVLIAGQHIGCNEHGLYPGSGSTHQVVYEWAFWIVTCLWEYYLHTGDRKLLRLAANGLPYFLEWCEKQFLAEPDGWVASPGSWMYTISFEPQPLAAVQAAGAICFTALEKLFTHLGMGPQAERTQRLRRSIQQRFRARFWDEELRAYRFLMPRPGETAHSDLCANCWAILSGLATPAETRVILESLTRLHWTPAGSINVAPTLAETSFHNNNIWPYANSYEVCARFHAGDTAGALEVFRRYIRRIRSIGHETLFEMIHLDGALPIGAHGNTLSFCHAWAAQGSWALQHHLLGVGPTRPGWEGFGFAPLASELPWVQGAVITPHGPIEVELEQHRGRLRGRVRHPRSIACERKENAQDVEILPR